MSDARRARPFGGHIARVALGGVIAGLAFAVGCSGPQVTPAPHPIADAPEDPAAEAFEAAANRPPTVRTVYVMAKLYMTQGKDAEAEGLLRQVIREAPAFIPAYCDLAELQLRKDRVEDAKRTLASGLKAAPGEPVLSNDLGMCYLRTGEYELALRAFRSACGARPLEPRYRTNAALATAMLGRYEDALTLYKQVLPEADAHYNLGVICESIQDHTRASQEFQKAIELGNNRKRIGAAESRALGLLAADAVRLRQAPSPTPPASTVEVATGAKGN